MKLVNFPNLLVPLLFGLSGVAPAAWDLVDDMESGNNWTGGGSVVNDPAVPTNNVYGATHSGTRVDAYRQIPAVALDTTGTLFFRIRTGGSGTLADWVVGASDDLAPVPFNSFEGYVRLAEDGTVGDIDLDVRNGGAFSKVGDVGNDVWFNVWLVLNNGTKTVDVYFNQARADATSPDTLSFLNAGFRNGAAATQLISLLATNNESGTTGYIDDIYIDLTGENLTFPIPLLDVDGDGLEDNWELANGLDPTDNGSINPDNGAEGDPDEDSFTNLQEFQAGTSPRNPDTDGDGLSDGDEFSGTPNLFDGQPTDPLSADSDGDGVSDFDENGSLNIRFANAPTDPNNPDTDGDGMLDGYELANNNSGTALDPNDDGDDDSSQGPLGDRDGDGLSNIDEFSGLPQTRADLADTDGDGLDDNVETMTTFWIGAGDTGTDPTNPDTDGDSLPDGQENLDLPSFPGAGVLPTNSDPNFADTDGDGYSDRFEVDSGTDPSDFTDQPTPPAGFILIEDFEGEGMTLDETFHGVNAWVSSIPGAALVADEPIAGGDRVGALIRLASSGTSSVSVHKSLTDQGLQVADGGIGTLFMQIYCSSNQVNQSYGLTDQSNPAAGDFAAYEAQAVTFRNNSIRVRDFDVFRDLSTFRVGQWTNIWIVADNDADTVRVFWESPQDATGQVEITDDGGLDPFGFRNGTLEALVKVLLVTASDADTDVRVLVDNIYMDAGAINLDTPATAKPLPSLAPRITRAGFDGTGDFAVTFTPGGNGFILTSSDDLQSPFEEETDAVYDGVDTFTVPAEFLNPGRDFFRVETP